MNKEDKEYLDKCLEPIKADMIDIKAQIKCNTAEMNQRVTYKAFFTIIGILMSIWLGVSGYIASQIHDLQNKTYMLNQNVSSIDGTLKSIEFIKIE